LAIFAETLAKNYCADQSEKGSKRKLTTLFVFSKLVSEWLSQLFFCENFRETVKIFDDNHNAQNPINFS
jgi:hypothetical protein